MGEFVRLEVADGVGTLRLDRPKMNAINTQLRVELREAAEEAARREDVRAVVLYGGERVFAAGADTAFDLLREVDDEVTTLLVIGHNPTMAYIAELIDDGEGDADAVSERVLAALG